MAGSVRLWLRLQTPMNIDERRKWLIDIKYTILDRVNKAYHPGNHFLDN